MEIDEMTGSAAISSNSSPLLPSAFDSHSATDDSSLISLSHGNFTSSSRDAQTSTTSSFSPLLDTSALPASRKRKPPPPPTRVMPKRQVKEVRNTVPIGPEKRKEIERKKREIDIWTPVAMPSQFSPLPTASAPPSYPSPMAKGFYER
ncbi:uncharacterized protein JCM6883_005948 [Sporobolomyces salmoneus]|uniref:uncharacterized protein n=1 Tax=Sporobolomyces salmoneus TaxID=183962 RepID=UPI00317398C5